MSRACNLWGERGVSPFDKEGGRHVWTPCKPVDRWNLVNVYGGVSSSLALQPFVGLRLEWADCGCLGGFLGFKNHKIHLMRPLFQEEP